MWCRLEVYNVLIYDYSSLANTFIMSHSHIAVSHNILYIFISYEFLFANFNFTYSTQSLKNKEILI